jgi:hypothetical protein
MQLILEKNHLVNKFRKIFSMFMNDKLAFNINNFFNIHGFFSNFWTFSN